MHSRSACVSAALLSYSPAVLHTLWSWHTRFTVGVAAVVSNCVAEHTVCAVQPTCPAALLWPASAAPVVCA